MRASLTVSGRAALWEAAMPATPWILVAAPRGIITVDDPRNPPAVVAVIRWKKREGDDAVQQVPAHRLAVAELHGDVTAVRVAWGWQVGRETRRVESWLQPEDVRGDWATGEEWVGMVGRRGVLG
jgi:hypothetical protein